MADPAPYVQPQAFFPDGSPVPAEQFADAAASGQIRFPKGARVYVRNVESGKLQTVDAADIQHPGVRVEPPDALNAEWENKVYGRGLGNQAKAAAAGAARTLTFGASDVVGREAGLSKDLDALRRQNPISSGVGEVAGALAPLVLSGGAAAGAEGAALGAEAASAARAADGLGGALRVAKAATAVPRAISKVGTIVERGVARGLAPLAEKGLAGKVAKRAIELGAQGAVEGGLYGAQGAISDQALQDHDQTAENFVSGLGHGALLGAGIGAGFGVIGELGAAGLRRSKGKLEAVAKEQAGRAIGGQAELRKLDARAPQATTDALKYTMETGEYAGQPLIAKGDKVDDIAAKLDHAVTEVGAKRNGVIDEIDEALQKNPAAQKAAPSAAEFVDGVKEQEWYRKLKNGPDRAKARAVDKQLGMLLEQDATDSASQINRIGLENTEYLRDGMRDLRVHREGYAGATPEEVKSIALGESPTKNSSRPFKPVEVSIEPQEDGTSQIVLQDGRHRMTAAREAGADQVMAKIRTYDKDLNIVKEEFAPLNIRASAEPVNTFKQLKSWQEQLRDVFQPRAGSAGGLPPTPPKAAMYLEKLERELKTYLDTKAETALTALGEDPLAYKDLTRQMHSMLSLRDVAKKTIDHGNRMLSPTDHGTGIAAFLASAVSGHPLGGLVYGAGTALANKLMRTRGNATLAALARDASDMTGTIDAAAEALTGKATDAVSSVTGQRGHDMPRPAAGVPALSKQFTETVEQVRRLATPEVVNGHVSSTVAGISDDYPEVGAAATRKLLEIYQQLGHEIPASAHSPAQSLTPRAVKPMVPPTAMRIYLSTVRGATNPRAVIADLGRGELDRDALAAVQRFYPKTFQSLRTKVADMVAERDSDLPYQKTIFLSTAFGFVGDPSLEPKNVAAIQQTFADMQKTGETQQTDRPTRPAHQIDAGALTNPMRLPSAERQDR